MFAQTRELDVFKAGEQLSDWHVLFHANGENAVALRIAGLHDALGQVPETSDFLTLLRLAAERYRTTGVAPTLESSDLSAAGLSPPTQRGTCGFCTGLGAKPQSLT